MDTLTPTDITLDKRAQLLLVHWPNGRECAYPLGPLRMACPCVDCRGGHEHMGRDHDPKSLDDLIPDKTYRVEHINIVGNYALQLVWDDGHDTGIYTWDYLYHLCPMEESGA